MTIQIDNEDMLRLEKKKKKKKHDSFSALVGSVFVELHLIFSSSLLKR